MNQGEITMNQGWQEELTGGAMFSLLLRRHHQLVLRDLQGGANVSALFFNADMPLERYNMPDTLKAQFTAYLTQGRTLHSDMGRILVSVIKDTCGWHDTICGVIDAKQTEKKFGKSSYQEQRNKFYRNGRDNFLIELSKHGLGKKDLHANVNFFSKVTVDERGNLIWTPDASRAGSEVVLRAEMNTLVILSNTPHPMHPGGKWSPPPVLLTVEKGEAPTELDACRKSRPENERGFINTEAYFRT